MFKGNNFVVDVLKVMLAVPEKHMFNLGTD